MNSYETIFKRKSIRKYDLAPLDDNTIGRIADYMKTLVPMYDNIKTKIKIVSQESVNNMFSIKAPHYIIAFSENKEGYLTNVGFMLQQMDLFLSSNGIGSCWVGMAKPTKETAMSSELEFVIVLACGKPNETLYRKTVTQFKRKSLSEICNSSKCNEILQAARLAPSATNSQPWYFNISDNVIHAYCVKPNIIKAFLYEKMNKIDMGIAICHLWLAIGTIGKNVEFISDEVAKGNPPTGYYYIVSIKFNNIES